MIRVDAARKIILENILPLKETETLNFISSLNRISAQAIKAKENIPPFNNSAMDGFAVRAKDCAAAAKNTPKILEVIEDLPAGYSAKKSVGPNQAMRIMTGAPLPRGADAVVMVEDTRPVTSKKEFIQMFKKIKPGENVRYAGEDVRKREVVIKKGTLLRAGHVGMLASLGISKIKVFRRPKVAILATGDELIGVNEKLKPGKIRNSNAYSLYSQIVKIGAVPLILGIARDKKKELEKKIKKGITADILLVSGGVSVGKYDFVKDVLRELGGKMRFWKVAMRPGKPLAFGVIGKTPVFGLPGNPVSSMVSFELFVRPAISRMMGQVEDDRKETEAILEENITKKKGLRFFLRTHTHWKDGVYYAKTTGPQGSGILKSMILANSIIILSEEKEFVKKGEKVKVLFLN